MGLHHFWAWAELLERGIFWAKTDAPNRTNITGRTARLILFIKPPKKIIKWRGVDLNHRPVGYEPNALSTELPRQRNEDLKKNDFRREKTD